MAQHLDQHHLEQPIDQRMGASAAVRVRLGCGLKSLYAEDAFAALSIRKGHHQSMVVLAHKMLRIVFSIPKSGLSNDNRAVDCEALGVQCNAPLPPVLGLSHRPDRSISSPPRHSRVLASARSVLGASSIGSLSR